jgi:hypothetical protein
MAGFEPATARLRIECSTTEPHRHIHLEIITASLVIMVQPNPKNRTASQLNSEQYARLKAEIKNPYRNVRKFIYVAGGASGLIGAFIFFFQSLAGRNLDTALPNLALQIGIIALVAFLWRWEEQRQKR